MAQEKKNIQEHLIKIAKSILILKDNKNAYKNISDNHKKYIYDRCDDGHIFAVTHHTTEEYILLLERIKDITKEFNLMKDFIIHDFSICSIGKTKTIKQDIKQEIDSNLDTLTKLSSIMADESYAKLQEDIVFNELESLTNDLEYRICSYRPYYQYHVISNKEDVALN